MNIYFDTEFTGLHQRTTLISLGAVSDDGRTFYAEFTDYKQCQVDEWVEINVLKNLMMPVLEDGRKSYMEAKDGCIKARGGSQFIAGMFASWLTQFEEQLYLWGDCPAYDWVLLCELFGGAQHIPECVYYIPLDLETYAVAKGLPYNFSRREMASLENAVQHNALDDAMVIRVCHRKIGEQ